MSVILDALHKARGEKGRGGKSESPRTVARVLDHGAAPGSGPVDFIGDRPMSRRRSFLALTLLMLGVSGMAALIGGGFYLLYNQVRRLEQKAVLQAAAEPAPVPVKAETLLDTSPLDVPPPTSLPTPLPLSDLPVQLPSAAAAAVPATTALAAVDVAASEDLPVSTLAAPQHVAVAPTQQPQAVRPELKLGSIVCEAGICVASLNGRSVRVGDEIRGYRVVEITETSISLKSSTGSDIITLSQFD